MKARIGDMLIDTGAREVSRDGQRIDLEPRTYELLVYLLQHRDRAVGKDELQDEVWGTIVSDSALTRSIMKLRKALGDSDEQIVRTVPRFGYRFVGDVTVLDDSITDLPSSGNQRQLRLLIGSASVIALAVFVFLGLRPEPVIEKSVAVLPFDDLSESQDHEWFADGLAEEILNALTRTPDLLVAGRTSSFAFRDSGLAVPELAARLGVAHILEGSVRRDGDRLRVTAQLIRANDGFHVWSENFDRDSSGVIDVQEEIASSIANALETAMDPAALARLVSSGTRSVPAYEAYLEGMAGHATMVETGDVDAYTRTIDTFERAVSLDPGFAAAHYEIASFWATQLAPTGIATSTLQIPRPVLRDRFLDAINLAIEHAPDPASELTYRAYLNYTDAKPLRALDALNELLAVRPNFADAQIWQISVYAQLNRFDEVVRRSFEIFDRYGYDPVVTARSLHLMQYSNDREATLRFAELARERLNEHIVAYYQLHRVMLWFGETADAKTLLPSILASDLPARNRKLAELRQLCAERNVEDANEIYESMQSDPDERLSIKWLAAEVMGDEARAVDMLRPFDEMGDPTTFIGLLTYGNFDPRPYPNLMRHLTLHSDENGHRLRIPYRCRQ